MADDKKDIDFDPKESYRKVNDILGSSEKMGEIIKKAIEKSKDVDRAVKSLITDLIEKDEKVRSIIVTLIKTSDSIKSTNIIN